MIEVGLIFHCLCNTNYGWLWLDWSDYVQIWLKYGWLFNACVILCVHVIGIGLTLHWLYIAHVTLLRWLFVNVTNLDFNVSVHVCQLWGRSSLSWLWPIPEPRDESTGAVSSLIHPLGQFRPLVRLSAKRISHLKTRFVHRVEVIDRKSESAKKKYITVSNCKPVWLKLHELFTCGWLHWNWDAINFYWMFRFLGVCLHLGCLFHYLCAGLWSMAPSFTICMCSWRDTCPRRKGFLPSSDSSLTDSSLPHHT